jgi:acetoacetate decarboxylase
MISYPPAPWSLQGAAIAALHLVDIDIARAFVPPRLRIVPVLPGRTLSVLYCAQYAAGSTLEYNELIVAAALIYSRRRMGFWISHIYVDDERALAGGHEIWRLPKEHADFGLPADSHHLTVEQQSRPLVSIRWQVRSRSVRAPLFLPVISDAFFKGRGTCRLSSCRAVLSVPPQSPFHALRFDRCDRVFQAENLKMVIAAPKRR